MEERTRQRGQNESHIGEKEKRNGKLVHAAENKLVQANKNARAALAKKKRNRAVCPKHQIMRGERVKVDESCTLVSEKGIRARACSGKGGIHSEERQIPRKKERASKKSLPRTSRRKHERVSGCKSSPGRSTESWFHSKSGQT